MRTLNLRFRVSNFGQIEYLTKNWREKVDEFKSGNELREGIVTFKINSDNVKHWQHKYYRGYLLPQISSAMHAGNLQETHDLLKEKFLFIKCGSVDAIEPRHLNRCNKYFYNYENDDGEMKRAFVGYTPSTGDLQDDEMNVFLRSVEGFGLEHGFIHLDSMGQVMKTYSEGRVPPEHFDYSNSEEAW